MLVPVTLNIANNPTTKDQYKLEMSRLLENVQSQLQKHQSILDCLPENPIPFEINLFGYCANQSIRFELDPLLEQDAAAQLMELLKAYPPVPLVDLEDGSRTQKPKEALRDSEVNQPYRDLAPVLIKASLEANKGLAEKRVKSHARWWTPLAVGLTMVEVALDAESHLTHPGKAYSVDTQRYSTGFCTFFVKDFAAFEKKRLSPLAQWLERRTTFVAKVNEEYRSSGGVPYFNGPRTSMLNVLHVRNRMAEQGYTMTDMDKDYTEHPSLRGSSPRELFDEDMLRRVFDFLQDQREGYAQAKATHQAEGQRVKKALCEYLSGFGGISNHWSTQTLLRRYANVVLKSPVDISAVRLKNEHQPDKGFLVSLQMEGTFSDPSGGDWFYDEFVVPCDPTKPMLTPRQLISDIEVALKADPETALELGCLY